MLFLSELINFREALIYLKSCVHTSELHCGHIFMCCTLIFQFISLSLCHCVYFHLHAKICVCTLTPAQDITNTFGLKNLCKHKCWRLNAKYKFGVHILFDLEKCAQGRYQNLKINHALNCLFLAISYK